MNKIVYSIEKDENIDSGHRLADAILMQKKGSDLEKIVEIEILEETTENVEEPDRKYKQFYNEGRNLSQDIFKETHYKLQLLKKHFPGQFGLRGRESLNGKESAYIGAKFNHLLNYAIKKLRV